MIVTVLLAILGFAATLDASYVTGGRLLPHIPGPLIPAVDRATIIVDNGDYPSYPGDYYEPYYYERSGLIGRTARGYNHGHHDHYPHYHHNKPHYHQG